MEMFIPSMIIAFAIATLVASFVSIKNILPAYLVLLMLLTVIGTLAIGVWMILLAILATPAFLSSFLGFALGAIIRAARLENLDRAFSDPSLLPAN